MLLIMFWTTETESIDNSRDKQAGHIQLQSSDSFLCILRVIR